MFQLPKDELEAFNEMANYARVLPEPFGKTFVIDMYRTYIAWVMEYVALEIQEAAAKEQ